MAPIPASLLRLFAPIEEYLKDATVRRIMVDGPDRVFVERDAGLIETDTRYSAPDLEESLRGLAQRAGKAFTDERPCLEAMLRDGTRFLAIRAPVVRTGPLLAVERPVSRVASLAELAEEGLMPSAAADALALAVAAGANIMVASPPCGARTTLVEALVGVLPHSARVAVVQESGEIRLTGRRPLRLLPRQGNQKVRAVSAGDLLYSAGRLGVARIVAVDIRLSEMWDCVSQLAARSAPILLTVPAFSVDDALARVEGMARASAVEPRDKAVPDLVSAGVDLIVELKGQARRITRIARVERGPRAVPLFDLQHGELVPADDLEAWTDGWSAALPQDVEAPSVNDPPVESPAVDPLLDSGPRAVASRGESVVDVLPDEDETAQVDLPDLDAPDPEERADGEPVHAERSDATTDIAESGPPVPKVIGVASMPPPPVEEDDTGPAVSVTRSAPPAESASTQALDAVEEPEVDEDDEPTEDPLRRLLKSLSDDEDEEEEETVVTEVNEQTTEEKKPAGVVSEKTFSQILRSIGSAKAEPDDASWESSDAKPIPPPPPVKRRRDRNTAVVHEDE